MKWVEGKYERRWRHSDNYYCWQDLLHVMLVTLVLAVIVALVIALLIMLVEPQQTSADDWVNLRVNRRLAAVVIPIKKVTTRVSKPVKTLFMEISCYSPTAAECDGNPLRTASGQRVRVGGVAADLSILPFGSQVIIPGYNGGKPCTVIDSGGAIHGLKLDIFMWSAHEAIHWGRRRNVRVEVLYIPRRIP